MARETKVGLIVGLGVILFVGVFVSDYLSVPQHQDELGAEDLANFHRQTTNQPQFVPTRDGDEPDARASDPARLAAAALEQAERRDGPPVVAFRDDPPVSEPPRREMTGQRQVDDRTPVAERAHTPPTEVIGRVELDDPALAEGHQVSPERIGPGGDTLEHIARVEIPDTPLITPQPRVQLHTVKSGETLSAIARKHYDGDGNMWRSIRDANPGKVGTNGEVREGVELVIPKRVAQADDPAGDLTERASSEGDRPARRRVRMITVKEGQTLSEIAAEHLGSANKWRDIMAVNDDVLEKPELLRAGMKLRIPADEEVALIEEANAALAGASGETPEREADRPAAESARTYVVKSNDNLSLIAAKELGDSNRYQEIFEANRDKLRSADAIVVGMKLTLPSR